MIFAVMTRWALCSDTYYDFLLREKFLQKSAMMKDGRPLLCNKCCKYQIYLCLFFMVVKHETINCKGSCLPQQPRKKGKWRTFSMSLDKWFDISELCTLSRLKFKVIFWHYWKKGLFLEYFGYPKLFYCNCIWKSEVFHGKIGERKMDDYTLLFHSHFLGFLTSGFD